MKKLLLLSILILEGLLLQAQTIKQTYFSEYFGVEREIEATINNDGELELFIHILGPEIDDDIEIHLKKVENIRAFYSSLLELKKKFAEWSKTAKENGITSYDKQFDIVFPRVDILWYDFEWRFCAFHKMKFHFRVLENGLPIAIALDEVKSTSDQFIEQKYYWAFKTPEEIESLANKINPKSLSDKLSKKKNPDDLFK